VLQEGEFRSRGSTQVKHVNVRIVAATNRRLEDEVRDGRFRQESLLSAEGLSAPSAALREAP